MVVGAGSIECRMVRRRRGANGDIAGGGRNYRGSPVCGNEAGILSYDLVEIPE